MTVEELIKDLQELPDDCKTKKVMVELANDCFECSDVRDSNSNEVWLV